MRLTITIEMDGAAFDCSDGYSDGGLGEVKRVLEQLDKMPFGAPVGWECKLRDSNGNTVGVAEVVED
jgi:hypothetical protein